MTHQPEHFDARGRMPDDSVTREIEQLGQSFIWYYASDVQYDLAQDLHQYEGLLFYFGASQSFLVIEDLLIDFCNKPYRFQLYSQGKPRIPDEFRLYMNSATCNSE